MNYRSRFWIAAIVLAPAIATAQPSAGEKPLAMERIEQLKKVRMIEALDLTEDQSVRFFARLNEHNKSKEELHRERMTALDKLERLIRNEAGNDEYRQTFSDIAAIDQETRDLDTAFFDGLADILSEEQRGKLLLFERQFHRELQDALRAVQRKRPAIPE
jgi:hypothetical protein